MRDFQSFRFQPVNTGTEDSPSFSIYEVYLDKDGSVTAYFDKPCDPNGWEDAEDLSTTLEMMAKDCRRYPAVTPEQLESMIQHKKNNK